MLSLIGYACNGADESETPPDSTEMRDRKEKKKIFLQKKDHAAINAEKKRDVMLEHEKRCCY